MISLTKALRLYLVADPDHAKSDLLEMTEAALRGGVSMVQLRAKQLTDRQLFELASSMCTLCHRFGTAFLVNDRVDLALASGADGVHLGVDDLPIEAARALGGSDFLIGYSPETDDQLESAQERGVDYLGIGPVFGTATKTDAGQALGIDEFHRRRMLGKLPSVGIGGITGENATSVMAAGADGIAVVSAILDANDPEGAARQLSLKANRSSTRGSSAGSQ